MRAECRYGFKLTINMNNLKAIELGEDYMLREGIDPSLYGKRKRKAKELHVSLKY